MAVFKCKMCGASLEVHGNESVCSCSYCGTFQTLPRFDNERKIALFTRANNLRIKSEFDKAAGIYESIVTEFRDEAEGYWGLVLCKYGIEYVDDGNGKMVPTCHRTLPLSVMDDDDFNQACEYADLQAKNLYRQEGKVIDKIQKKILDIAVNEEPYDIFICYKENDDITSERTEDSLIAQDIYTHLIKGGYNVFFARDTLKFVAGTEYEPYIYAALSSSRLMLAIGTRFEYFDSVWVKNEWSRFISMMTDNTNKILIPCYKNMDAYDMPKEFKNMQALDMGEVTFFGSLMDNIERVIEKTAPKGKGETVILNSDVGDLTPVLERGFMLAEDKEWSKADQLFETALNKDPRNGKAYLGKLFVDLQVSNFDELSKLSSPFSSYGDYERIMRFGDDELKCAVKNCNDSILRRNEEEHKKDIYENALEMMDNATTEEMYENAGYLFIEVKDYADAKEKSDQCFELAEKARLKAEAEEIEWTYNKACSDLCSVHKTRGNLKDIPIIEKSAKAFQWLGNYRDSKERYHQCLQTISIIKKEADEIRIAQIQQYEMKKELYDAKVKKRQKLFVIISAIVSIVIVLSLLLYYLIIPQIKKAVFISNYGENAYATLGLVEIGSYITFGGYEQNNVDSDGKEDIEWLVLDIKDGKALLTTKYILDCKAFNDCHSDNNYYVTWETSTLRHWLNNEFFDTAFSENEKNYIPTVTVLADENPDYTDGNVFQGSDTEDKVFLLSVNEANNYFSSDEKRKCEPTEYAEHNGVSRDECWCWLRTVGKTQDSVAEVEDGYVFSYGRNACYSYAVRPAMWISLE